jgi:hypothetical protein
MQKKTKKALFVNAKKRSLESVVGEKTYSVWVDMLKELVPHGRTHRLSVVVAGMLQYASQVASKKSGNNPKEGSVEASLIYADELGEEDGATELSDLIEQLFEDAKIPYRRRSSRGTEYSIINDAMIEYFHWQDMPWE